MAPWRDAPGKRAVPLLPPLASRPRRRALPVLSYAQRCRGAKAQGRAHGAIVRVVAKIGSGLWPDTVAAEGRWNCCIFGLLCSLLTPARVVGHLKLPRACKQSSSEDPPRWCGKPRLGRGFCLQRQALHVGDAQTTQPVRVALVAHRGQEGGKRAQCRLLVAQHTL